MLAATYIKPGNILDKFNVMTNDISHYNYFLFSTLYRDFKLENILFDSKKNVKLIGEFIYSDNNFIELGVIKLNTLYHAME